jgi:hypothetical protein
MLTFIASQFYYEEIRNERTAVDSYWILFYRTIKLW